MQRLISFLEASPMNRQPVPDAGRKLTAYYRRLQRKPQETIPQFLIREETLYDEMWRSLQRLLKEKQIDFDQYDTSLDELKRFCGMKDDQSIFVPGGSDGASRGTFSHTDPENPFDGESEGEQPPGMTTPASTIPIGAPPPKVERRGFDLIERLMQKGLIPLAALDIIRGWLVLESTSATELDKSLVKASTQNKLGYQNIRSALLALHEDRSRGIGSLSKGFSKGKFSHHFMDEYQYSEDLHYGEPWGEEQEYYGDWNEPYGEDGFYGEEFQQEPVEPSEGDPSQGDATQSEEQAVHALSQLEEEEKELAAMMADAQRNLEQARRAVAEAKKDRGWKSSSGGSHFGKGSPPHFGQKGTSTFMKGGKGKVNYMQRGRGKGQGRFQYPQRMNRFPPRRPPFMQNQSGMYMENDGFHFMSMMDVLKYNKETEQLRLQVEREREEQAFLLAFIDQDLQREEKDRQWVFQLEFDVTDEIATSGNPILYVKRILESKNTEVSYRQLAPEHIPLFDEAKAKEVSEVLGSLALRAIQSKEEFEDAMKHPERNIPMRWVLTWKPIIPPEPPEPGKPTTVVADGSRKAKARVVLLGFRHPDLVKRNPVTGQHELRTAAPTISRTGRNLLLQCFAFDEHRLESADAKSAFLQADNLEESRRIWTTAVPELARAHNVRPGELLRVLGAIYGLTNAPRIFWKDADGKLQKLGGKHHPMDRCIWTFVDPKTGIVCGRIGSQVDDFLIGGNEKNEHWQHVRSQIKKMYQWSPWQSGDFIYAGCHLRQLSSFTIHLSQEEFCDALRPVEISQDGSRSATDKMSPQELSQCRALVMKAQWRALQSAPQYSARVGIAASTLTNGNLQNLREANSLVRDMRKSSKENLVFHNFNFGKEKRMKYTDLIFAHWGDAGHNNRPTGGSTGGYVTGITVPQILSGKESPVTIVDWRSWKLRRPARGTNCSEAQGIAESEDKGWRCRLFFALLYGHDLIRGEADKLTALFTSFLIMDSRGCYDLLVGNESLAMSMEDSKAAIDLLHVQHGTSDGSNCFCTWVPSDLNLANSLTKATSDAFREMKLYHTRKSWIIKFNSEFISARKAQRLRVQKAKEEQDQNLHFADFPDQWFDDSWSALFGSPYQR